jgi:N-acetylglucosaminyldiphosphoundecaprenol N-acetyl-beta-D-mannosaminyltransferase
VPISSLVKKIIETNPDNSEIFENAGRIYTFLNPVSYLEAVKNPVMYNNFDGIFADGFFLALAIRLCFHKRIKRCSFDMTSLASKLFSFAQVNKKSLYVIGSKQNEISRFMEIVHDGYPDLNFAGFRNGYFDSEKDLSEEICKIVDCKPDFVICGMGAGSQESFLIKLKENGFRGVAFTCGGFITQTSKNSIMYYPKFFDLLNLRFVYRMIREKHTRKRYLRAFFCFPVRFVRECVKSRDQMN